MDGGIIKEKNPKTLHEKVRNGIDAFDQSPTRSPRFRTNSKVNNREVDFYDKIEAKHGFELMKGLSIRAKENYAYKHDDLYVTRNQYSVNLTGRMYMKVKT